MIGLLATVKPISAHRLEVQALKSLVVFVLLAAGFRLFGKRELAQLNVYDLAMLMALANAVQNAMTGGLGNFPVGIVTSSTVLLAAWVATRVFRRYPGLERSFVGSPVLLVRDGRVLHSGLRRQRVTRAEVAAACRQHGLPGPRGCALAVLEVDGSISVIPKRADRSPDEPPG